MYEDIFIMSSDKFSFSSLHEFAGRLRSERERLWPSQKMAGERCGVSGRSWADYEEGKVAPKADVLLRLHAAGADVPYILTGQRSAPADTDATLRPVVEAWSKLTAAQQALLLGLMRELGGDAVRTQAVPLGRTGPQPITKGMAASAKGDISKTGISGKK